MLLCKNLTHGFAPVLPSDKTIIMRKIFTLGASRQLEKVIPSFNQLVSTPISNYYNSITSSKQAPLLCT